MTFDQVLKLCYKIKKIIKMNQKLEKMENDFD